MSSNTLLITHPVCIFNQTDKNQLYYTENPILITFDARYITLRHPGSDNHVAINIEFLEPLFTTIQSQMENAKKHSVMVEEHYKQKFEIEKAKVDKNKNGVAK